MTALGNPEDLSIGPSGWIRWVDLPASCGEPFQLDPYLDSMESFWDALEQDCVAECCGIQAFQLWPGNIADAVHSCGDSEIAAKLRALRSRLADANEIVVRSARLNQLFDRRVFLALLDHVIVWAEPGDG